MSEQDQQLNGFVYCNGAAVMDESACSVPEHFWLKQIENELNAAFLFVAVARKAYADALMRDGDTALQKAVHLQQSATERAAQSVTKLPTLFQVQALSERIRELQAAVDQLMVEYLQNRKQ